MALFRWLQKRGSTGAIARWAAQQFHEGRRLLPDASDAELCEAMLAARFTVLPMGPSERTAFDRILAQSDKPQDLRSLAHFVWDVEIGSQLGPSNTEQSLGCHEIIDGR
jgi:hypothetical protein